MRLCLSVIAYNLGNLWGQLALPKRIGGRSLTSLEQRKSGFGSRQVSLEAAELFSGGSVRKTWGKAVQFLRVFAPLDRFQRKAGPKMLQRGFNQA